MLIFSRKNDVTKIFLCNISAELTNYNHISRISLTMYILLFSPGKPKIVIFQACLGTKFDEGITLIERTQADGGGARMLYKIPKTADFIIIHASFQGWYTLYREKALSNPFVKAFDRGFINVLGKFK